MSRKKILWLCSWYPGKTDRFNGDFIQRHAKAAALFNDIYVIHVTTVPGNQLKQSIEKEIVSSGNLTERIIYIKSSRSLVGRIISNYKLLRLFKKAIKEYTGKGNPGLLHVHIPMKAGIAGMWAKRKFKLPLLMSEHWGIYNDIVKDNYYQRSRFFKTLTKRVIAAADVFISVSNFLLQQINHLTSVKDHSIIPNTVDTGLFYHTPAGSDVFRFIHVSNMVPLKNAEGILRAFGELIKERPAELVMVGNTDDSIQKWAAGSGLMNKVSFRGEISYAAVAKEMQGADCLVLFSNIENSPCVIGEAFCCGLPVIASAVGGVPELVDGANGFLVNPGNENDLKAAMLKMMNEYSKFDRVKISETAKQKFSYTAVGKQFDELYSSVISNSDKRSGA